VVAAGCCTSNPLMEQQPWPLGGQAVQPPSIWPNLLLDYSCFRSFYFLFFYTSILVLPKVKPPGVGLSPKSHLIFLASKSGKSLK
jgi:hypothetical protein